VQRIIVGNYELRYEIADATISILHFWHCRENTQDNPAASDAS